MINTPALLLVQTATLHVDKASSPIIFTYDVVAGMVEVFVYPREAFEVYRLRAWGHGGLRRWSRR